MRCRLAIIGLLASAPLAAMLGWWLLPESRVSADNYACIRKGMALSEVEEILGARGAEISLWGEVGEIDEDGFTGFKLWSAGACTIVVAIEGNRVSDKLLDNPTLWERLDDWYRGRDREWLQGIKILPTSEWAT